MKFRLGLALLIPYLALLSVLVSQCFKLMNMPNDVAVALGLLFLVLLGVIITPSFMIWWFRKFIKPTVQ